MDNTRSIRSGAAYLLRRTKSAVPSFRVQSNEMNPSESVPREPNVVLYVDEHCPMHGSQGKCTCASYTIDKDGLGSTHTLQQNVDHTQNERNITEIKPFSNNPPLPHTQRDIVGNNLYFNSPRYANGWNNEQYDPMMLYRNALKQNLTSSSYDRMGYSKMRIGRSGGHWRHIQQTNSHAGSNLLYINGTVRVDDNLQYPTSRFGHPSFSYSQSNFASTPPSYQLSNSTTNSTDSSTWSARMELNRRPSLSQYSNRYQQHAKEGFAYWPMVGYKKPRCKTGTTGTYKTWLGLSDSILKL